MMASQAQQRESPSGSSRGLPELTGPWPRIAQILWVIVLLVVLTVLAYRLRPVMEQVHQLCKMPDCQGAQLTHEQAHLLHDVGLPVEAFGVYSAALTVFAQGVFWVVAGIIIWRNSKDPMAVLTAFTLVAFGSLTVGGFSSPVPAGLPAALDLPVRLLALFGALAILVFFYLFPDGRLVLRWPVLLAAPQVVFQVAQYLAPGSVLATTRVPHNAVASNILGAVSLLTFAVALSSLIYVQIYRYRKASTPAQRQQTKWMVYGSSLAITTFLVTVLSFAIPGLWNNPMVQFIGNSVLAVIFVLLPLAIGFAILRYRLWDVDLLINRTLVYGLLTALLATLYVSSVVLLQAALRVMTGQGSGLAVAISTLAIAALFQPLRRGIQAFIDRRFYRRKYDAARTLAKFGERVRGDVNLDELTGDILAIVHETMGPAHVSLWLVSSSAGEEAGL